MGAREFCWIVTVLLAWFWSFSVFICILWALAAASLEKGCNTETISFQHQPGVVFACSFIHSGHYLWPLAFIWFWAPLTLLFLVLDGKITLPVLPPSKIQKIE